MSNRLAIDPSETKLSDPAAMMRRRAWARLSSPRAAAEDAPVAKAVDVDFSGDDELSPEALAKDEKRKSKSRKKTCINVETHNSATIGDVTLLYRLVYASPNFERRPIRQIIHEVCRMHNVDVTEILGPRRHKKAVDARLHTYYALARERPDISYSQIGAHIGDRDHSTIANGVAVYAARNGLPPVVRS